MPKQKKNKTRKYVPHKAAAEFEPTMDWSEEEARTLFDSSVFSFSVDKVDFSNCISGMRNLPDDCIDMIIADPPFGIDFNKLETLYNRDSEKVVKGYKEVKPENYSEFSEKWISELPRIMKNHAGLWIFSGWTNLDSILNSLKNNNLEIINHIIWKYQFGAFTQRKFVSSHYHILFAVKDEKNYFFNKIKHYPLDVWEINRTYRRGKNKNATKLPVKVVQKCLDFGSKPGDLILDPFMGNGTTAEVALGSYRHFYGFEINEQLRPIIVSTIKKTEAGSLYIPYSNRHDELVEKAKKKFNSK